ncbi:hypothetical protein L3Q82_015680 [Scortum barcoo]|uniref:Uncharacterized protein n=1 Tax=Scortum barcoo TaxID=214431 RepID=A0ACB8VPN9_9TELE|nr:hypothetical protein L3Q82_015680 [Scortum barcoo]
MALQKLLRTLPETPYSRPPPLHVSVVALKEQPRVVSWLFDEDSVRPSVTKKNIWAVISDGFSVT